jgi:hypothetical protein
MDLLKKYCLDDVRVTKEVYEYALKNQKIIFQDYFSTQEVPIKCEEPKQRIGVQHQSALF